MCLCTDVVAIEELIRVYFSFFALSRSWLRRFLTADRAFLIIHEEISRKSKTRTYHFATHKALNLCDCHLHNKMGQIDKKEGKRLIAKRRQKNDNLASWLLKR